MIFYIINAALVLAGCLVFYKLLLQKETFFPLNRFVLLAFLFLSFGLPLIPVPAKFSFRKPAVENVITSLPVSNTIAAPAKTTSGGEQKVAVQNASDILQGQGFFDQLPVIKILFWGYWLGVAVFAINFLVQLITLLYRAYSRPVIRDGRFRIVELSGDQAPCSFGNNIFINPEKYEWDTYSQIILHEKVHIEQGHSYDILLAELALIFQWFNPFAWFYRKAMEDNLEFLTDNELLANKEVEKSSYQMSLVKVSAPHFPVSLTTNYNQSVLKKRLMMMNAKKSNLNTTWKYLFILPLMLAFVCFLNDPVAYGKTTHAKANINSTQMTNEGSWFATIKGDKISFIFQTGEEESGRNNSTFDLADLSALPNDKAGTFTLTRDAGTMTFTGKFEGTTGMGKYKFSPDKSFSQYLEKAGIIASEGHDMLVFFMINVTKNYVAMLQGEGYPRISKNDIIPLVAMKIDQDFIHSLKKAGYDKLELKDMIPLKALGVDAAYINDIKSSGYKNITVDRLITLKAQGIDGDYIKKERSARLSASTPDGSNENYNSNDHKGNKGSKGPKGNKNGMDDEYEQLGKLGELIAKKVLNVTAEYAKSFADIGFRVAEEELIAMRSLGITADFIKSFEPAGIKLKDSEVFAVKSLGITPEDVKAYKKLGFSKISIDDIIAAKTMGVTPAYILMMRKNGLDYSTIDRYIETKSVMYDKDNK